jgi:hypothetical protein
MSKTATLIPPGKTAVETIESFGRMMTVNDLAPILGYSPKGLYAKVKTLNMPVSYIGAAIRFDPYNTAEWLRKRSAA